MPIDTMLNGYATMDVIGMSPPAAQSALTTDELNRLHDMLGSSTRSDSQNVVVKVITDECHIPRRNAIQLIGRCARP